VYCRGPCSGRVRRPGPRQAAVCMRFLQFWALSLLPACTWARKEPDVPAVCRGTFAWVAHMW